MPRATHEEMLTSPTTVTVIPRLSPGIRAKSATAKVFTSAEKATPARMSISSRVLGSSRAGATEMATNRSPTRAPATAAVAAKNWSKSEGTTESTVPQGPITGR